MATLAVCLCAAGARFARLGVWSFGIDEVATIRESSNLLDNRPISDDQSTRLPRIAPLGFFLHGLAYRELGQSEFAARVPAAIAGVFLCGIVVVGLWGPLGGWTATATGLLLALCPEAIFYSQSNRFYSLGACLAGACVMAGLAAVRNRSVGWMFVASLFAALGMADHLLLVGLFPGLLAAALLAPGAFIRDRLRLAAVVLIVGAGVATVEVLSVYPLAKGWNQDADWGYSLPRALAGGVNQLGASTAILAGLGAVLMTAQRQPYRWFWAVWAGGWLASLVVLPRVISFHPGYSFLYILGPIVLSGYAVGQVAERLAAACGGTSRGAIPAALWVLAAPLFNAAALVSYYMDGSRFDFRAGASFVAEHMRPGELLAAGSPGNFTYYSPVFSQSLTLNPNKLGESFALINAANQPRWIALLSGRTPRQSSDQQWLNDHCRLKAVFRKPRFDYYDFGVEVYLFEPKRD